MSFQQGLSGLNAASTQLDAIGNNVANASTVGFKAGQVQFADVYASSLNNASATNIGIGVKIGAISQQFTQGNVTTTENPLDIAINGDGFFRVSNGGVISYTRNGQFTLDKDGFIVTSNGNRLTGYTVNANGALMQGSPVELNVDTSDLAPKATVGVVAKLNLDSTEDAIDTAAPYQFDPADPATYTNATTVTVYDSLGNAHDVQTFYVKSAANTWNVWAIEDAAAYATGAATIPPPAVPAGITQLGTLNFTSSGAIDTATTTLPFTANIVVGTGAVTTLDINIDYTGTSQYGSAFGVNKLTQDGFASGRLSSFTVSSDGTLTGSYTNGKTSTLGQVVLANFSNPSGLQSKGDNLWGETATSGQPLVGTPESSDLGVLQSYAVEDSNVDLTAELVNMITAQRYYQANAQTIKTQDAVMQTLVSLR